MRGPRDALAHVPREHHEAVLPGQSAQQNLSRTLQYGLAPLYEEAGQTQTSPQFEVD
jgi:hypothetical protein